MTLTRTVDNQKFKLSKGDGRLETLKSRREREGTYFYGSKFVVNLVVGFTIKELGHVHGTDE